MAQYAKFVRNGAVRVDATGGATVTYHSAFINAGKLVIVSINTSSQTKNQTFTISNGNAASMRSYTTSNAKSLLQDSFAPATFPLGRAWAGANGMSCPDQHPS